VHHGFDFDFTHPKIVIKHEKKEDKDEEEEEEEEVRA
jgi:hypothetical protein